MRWLIVLAAITGLAGCGTQSPGLTTPTPNPVTPLSPYDTLFVSLYPGASGAEWTVATQDTSVTLTDVGAQEVFAKIVYDTRDSLHLKVWGWKDIVSGQGDIVAAYYEEQYQPQDSTWRLTGAEPVDHCLRAPQSLYLIVKWFDNGGSDGTGGYSAWIEPTYVAGSYSAHWPEARCQ